MSAVDSNDMPVRKSRVIGIDQALSHLSNGMTVAIGGFINSSHPMMVVREIIKRRLRDLTVVGAASSGLEIDLLIGLLNNYTLINSYGKYFYPVFCFYFCFLLLILHLSIYCFHLS